MTESTTSLLERVARVLARSSGLTEDDWTKYQSHAQDLADLGLLTQPTGLDQLVALVKDTGGAVEVRGVRIEPCDQYGQTDTTKLLNRLSAKLGVV